MRHLESEDLATSSAEVARLWEDAYTELIELERKMLDRLHSVLPTLSAPARRAKGARAMRGARPRGSRPGGPLHS